MFCYGWLLKGGRRTFSPFHRGVVTTYTLEVGAAGDGDNQGQSFSAFRATRYSIHDILPICLPNKEQEFLFHSNDTAETGGHHGGCSGHARSARAAAGLQRFIRAAVIDRDLSHGSPRGGKDDDITFSWNVSVNQSACCARPFISLDRSQARGSESR